MSEQDWDNDLGDPEPNNTSSFVDEGRSYGKGRGYKPMNNNNNDYGVGRKYGTDSSGFETDNEGNIGGRNKSGGFSDEGGFGGGSNGFDGERRGRGGGRGGGGYRNRDNDGINGGGGGWGGGGDGFDDDGNSRPSRGRGGRSGGRGGFRNRNDDGEGGGGGWGGGGFDGDDGNFKSSRGRGGGRGGGRGRSNRDDGGGFGQSTGGFDDENGGGRGGGGFDDENGGGRGGGGFDDENGGGRGGGGFDGDNSDFKSSRGRGGGRGGGRGRSNRDGGDDFGQRTSGGGFGDEDGEDPSKPAPVTYVPPELSTEDSAIFSGVDVGINFAKYDSIPVNVSGDNIPPAAKSFESMGLRKLVLDNVVKSGYTKPTPVQKHAIPIIMAARDLMACAQTGSGKTAAFLVPIINTLLEQPTELKLIGGGCEPHCVVISPTRELASQIWQQALKFAKDSIIKCVVAYGGVATQHVSRQVEKGCHILVATPGRLLDMVERRRVSFASLRYIILDEADRMLDMGFIDDVKKMMDHESMVAKGERQTLMFSATFPENVQTIAADFLHDYVFLSVGIIGGACTDVEQTFYEVAKFEKRAKLVEIIERDGASNLPRTLVFVEMKKTADFIAAFLSGNKFPTTSMHGDRTQEQRETALKDFKTGKMPILVATAVAARGLDIKDVAHVINFDMPKEIDEYVHRIGRTGRVGNCGKATSFFDPEANGDLVSDLVRVLSQAGQEVPDWLAGAGGRCAPNRGEKFGGRDVRNFGNDGTYDNPSTHSNAIGDAEPEEVW